MKSRKIYYSLLAITIVILCLAPLLMFTSGCKTTSTVTPTTNTVTGVVTLTTNTVQVVDPVALSLAVAGSEGITAIAVTTVVKKDPGAIPVLKDAQTALTGVLTGASASSTSQVLATLGQSNDATLSAAMTPIIQQISVLEQGLIARFGAQAGGQITLAIASAVNAGITVGLAGK